MIMDIYRFFHPHHNPRLLGTPLRQQELGELEQAASELLRALKRAQLRCQKQEQSAQVQQLSEPIQALQFTVNRLAELCDKHPGDSLEDLYDLISERGDTTGWANWSELVREQLAYQGEQNYIKENHPPEPRALPQKTRISSKKRKQRIAA
jgi:predicted nuclease with TOPRIM domain